MASNLSTIGFEFTDDDQFVATMTRLADTRDLNSLGSYQIWRSPSGAELWFHVRNDGAQLVGVTPFFEGKSAIPVRVTDIFQRQGDSEFEGALSTWLAPPGEPDVYPIVFDSVDFKSLSSHTLPFEAKARIAAFAFRIRAFSSVDAFEAAQSNEVKYAPQSFVPVGMFSSTSDEEGSDATPPASHAMFNGKVIEARLETNEITGRTFHVLLVESLDATFDVIADPAIVEGEIIPGGVVEVLANLFGRLLP